jgi:two-component sensor histidine kinase/CHASE3 domain sensor protein
MPLSSRLVIGSSAVLLTVGFLTLLAIVAMTAWLGEKANLYFDESIQSRGLRVAAVELRSALQSAESSQRGYLVEGNEIYLAPYDAAKAEALAQFDRLKQLLAPTADNQAILARISRLVPDKITEMDRTIALRKALDGDQAIQLFRSNRGKALMDEANLFLSSIVRQADARLETVLDQQRQNAGLLRFVTLVGGAIILLVVAASTAAVYRYAWEVSQARNELDLLNHTLEDRVARRTSELAEARDRAELLVAEINHRVANSLSLVSALVKLQSNSVADPTARAALAETEARIFAVASVHRRLYSGDNARVVDLDLYLSGVLESVESSLKGQGNVSSLRYELEPVKLKTDSSINLGVIVTELVTNAFKYAYPTTPGEVRVRLRRLESSRAELLVEDDGVGRAEGPPKGTGLGTRIVTAMARSIGAQLDYVVTGGGTVARLAFSPSEEG